MHFSTAAQALAALFLQPAEAPAAVTASPDYVILADQARRERLERLFARRPASASPLRESTEGGMWFVSCVTIWRSDPGQMGDCLASRLSRQGPAGTIVLNTYHPGTARGGLTVTCHGPGGIGRAVLCTRERRQDGAALEACLAPGLRAPAAPPRQRLGVGWSERFALEDVGQARREAKRVWAVAIDHVGVPRGTTGHCLVQGRVMREERGSGVRPGALVEAGIPCSAHLGSHRGTRRISMGAIRQGGFARLYLGEKASLADFEPLDG